MNFVLFKRTISFILICIIFLSSCALKKPIEQLPPQDYQTVVLNSTPTVIIEKPLDLENIRRKTNDFKRKLQSKQPLQKVFRSEKFKKSDFYIKDNKEIISSKGYRYIDSEALYVEDLTKTGKIKANQKDIYFTFDDYNDGQEAVSHLQAPHNARYKIEFDIKQVLDDIKIPKDLYGTGKKLEPLSKSYPDLGVGEATQVVVRKDIQASKIIDLKTGKIIYETK